MQQDGLYDKYQLIDSVILQLNQVDVRGVKNMKALLDCIGMLDALKKGLAEEDRRNDHHNGQGENL